MARDLAALDPLTADPAGMAIRLHLPEGVGIDPGTAALRLIAENGAGERVDERYALRPIEDAWRLNRTDRARLRTDQARVLGWETADPDGTRGSFAVGLTPCVTADRAPDGATLSADLQIAPDAPFRPLLRDQSIAGMLARAGTDTISPCP